MRQPAYNVRRRASHFPTVLLEQEEPEGMARLQAEMQEMRQILRQALNRHQPATVKQSRPASPLLDGDQFQY